MENCDGDDRYSKVEMTFNIPDVKSPFFLLFVWKLYVYEYTLWL